jgi:hypothetical protein
MEDLEERILRALTELWSEGDQDHVRARAPRQALARLDELIQRHNRYYPIEAELPLHPRTGALMERNGLPWQPRPFTDLEALIVIARGRADAERNKPDTSRTR